MIDSVKSNALSDSQQYDEPGQQERYTYESDFNTLDTNYSLPVGPEVPDYWPNFDGAYPFDEATRAPRSRAAHISRHIPSEQVQSNCASLTSSSSYQHLGYSRSVRSYNFQTMKMKFKHYLINIIPCINPI